MRRKRFQKVPPSLACYDERKLLVFWHSFSVRFVKTPYHLSQLRFWGKTISSQKCFILIFCGFWGKFSGQLFKKKPTRLSKLRFIRRELRLKGQIKIILEIMKLCFFVFAISTTFFSFFGKEAQQCCRNSISGVPLVFWKKLSAQKLLVCIHFRSWSKIFTTFVQKQSNVVVRISFHASTDIVWGKKIMYKEARIVKFIFELWSKNFSISGE